MSFENKERMKKIIISLVLVLHVSLALAQQPRKLDIANYLINKENVKGCALIYDPQTNNYYTNDIERCNTGFIPASTFKIANTLIALETGIINTEQIFKWDGKEKQVKLWEADMDIAQAYRVSNVPLYQQIAREIGLERMQNYIRLFNYGSMDINANNLDKFWLEGNSKITPYQQIYFLEKLYNEGFSLKKSTYVTMKSIMLWEDLSHYTLYAKTGRAARTEQNIGWFVGYVEKENNVYFFAINIEPTDDTNMNRYNELRIGLTKRILDTFFSTK